MSFKYRNDPNDPPNRFKVKSDNGMFLHHVVVNGGRIFLQFLSDDPPHHEEKIRVPNAEVKCYWIGNMENHRYWCRDSDNCITDHSITDHCVLQDREDMKFSVDKLVNEEYWTIKNLGNNMLCSRATVGHLENCLKADVNPDVGPIPAVAKFELIEVPPSKGQAEASVAQI